MTRTKHEARARAYVAMGTAMVEALREHQKSACGSISYTALDMPDGSKLTMRRIRCNVCLTVLEPKPSHS